MKKLFNKLIAVSLVFSTILSTTACSKTNAVEDTFQADYGSVYYLPVETGATYSVYSPNGEKVSLYNDGFIANSLGDYQIVKTSADKTTYYKLQVKDLSAPVIKTQYEKRFVGRGVSVSLPEIIVVDNHDKAVSYKAYLVDGENKTQVSSDFTFENNGEYTLEIVATDKAGNNATSKVTYEVVDNLTEKLETIVDLSSPYGINQVHNPYGYTVSYQTEIKCDGEQGATKFSLDSSYGNDHIFRIQNATITDISKYTGIYFSVYNDSERVVPLSLNYALNYTLRPKQWTEILLTDLDKLVSWTPNTSLMETFKLTNINGLSIMTEGITMEVGEEINIYFSSIYGIPALAVKGIEDRIDSLPETLTSANERQCKLIERYYKALSTLNKKSISNYKEFSDKYFGYLRNKNGITSLVDNKAFYLDTAYGVEQVYAKSENGADNFEDCLVEFSTKRYGAETGSTKITTRADCWNTNFYFHYSQLDIGDYEKMIFYIFIDNDIDKDGKDDGNTYNLTTNILWDEVDVSIKVGEWSKIEIPIGHIDDLVDKYFLLRCNNWDSMFLSGFSFYVSAIYFVR